MRTLKILVILMVCSSVVFLMGLRPEKYVEPNEVDTLLGTLQIPDGFEARTLSGGKVQLRSEAGLVVIIDELAADRVADGGYTSDSIKPILAKIFEPKVVKDPEIEAGALLFRGFGAMEGITVAFYCNLVDTSTGAGMILVYGPNSMKDDLQGLAEDVVLDLLE